MQPRVRHNEQECRRHVGRQLIEIAHGLRFSESSPELVFDKNPDHAAGVPNRQVHPLSKQTTRITAGTVHRRTSSLWRKSRIRPGPGAVEFRTLNGMAMGKRPAARQASPMWVDTADLPTNDGHPYFERLNRVLADSGFDAFVEELCAAFYADRLGRPSLRPGRYFRMLFIGYFEGLTPLYVKNARGSTTARSVRGELKALASLGSRSPRTVNHGRQPAARVLRCAPALRVTAAADRAGSPCGPAGRLALDPLPGSATPASHSVVAENRRQTPEWDRVHLPDRGFAVARTIRKHAVGILAYLDTRMTERARGRTHPARPTG